MSLIPPVRRSKLLVLVDGSRMSGRRTSGTSRPSLAAQVLAVFCQRAANGGSDPSWLNLAFLGRPDFRPKVRKPFQNRYLGTSGLKIGAPQKRQIQPRRIWPPFAAPLILNFLHFRRKIALRKMSEKRLEIPDILLPSAKAKWGRRGRGREKKRHDNLRQTLTTIYDILRQFATFYMRVSVSFFHWHKRSQIVIEFVISRHKMS